MRFDRSSHSGREAAGSRVEGGKDPEAINKKILYWLIALCGLWEFGDIAALFVPDFGEIPAFLWSHILTGLVLIILGIWAARTRQASTARKLSWLAAAAGAWLIVAPFLLGRPEHPAGLWNDVIVGAIVVVLSVWAALATPGAED